MDRSASPPSRHWRIYARAHAFEILSGVLGASDADLNRAALLAVGMSKRAEALPQLLAALESTDAATRLVALSALAELGLPDALPAIARATRDPDEGVRVAALGFLAARSDLAATNELLALLLEAPRSEALDPRAGQAGAGSLPGDLDGVGPRRRCFGGGARGSARPDALSGVARDNPRRAHVDQRCRAPRSGLCIGGAARRRERCGARACCAV